MKSCYILLFYLALSFATFSQPAFNWELTNDTTESTTFLKMIVEPVYGSTYVTGYNYSSPTIKSTLMKIDQYGSQLWQIVDTGLSNHLFALDLIADDHGDIYTAGEIMGPSGTIDGYLYKYDESGQVIWQRYYNGLSDSAAAIISLTFFNSYIYAAGSSSDLNSVGRIFIQKYDTLGNLIWTVTDSLQNNKEDAPSYITHDSQNILVTGYTNRMSIQYKMFIAKYNAVNGTKMWQAIDNMSSYENNGEKIATDSQDNIYVTLGRAEYNLVKYNSSGIYQWGYAIPDVGNSPGTFGEIKIDAADKIYVSGRGSISGGIDGLPAFLLTKFDPAGNVLFNYLGQQRGYAGSFDFLSPNEIVITGQLDSLGQRMINFDTSGNILWNHLYSNDVAAAYCGAVVVDDMNNILLGGRARLTTAWPMQVVKYGNQIFTRRESLPAEPRNILFPNPANEWLTIDTREIKIDRISVFNSVGMLLQTINCPQTNRLDVSGLSPGVYFIQTECKNGVERSTFVKI